MAVDRNLMVLPDNKQKQGVYRRGSVAKSPSEGAAALRTDIKGADEGAEVAAFLGEVTKWFPAYTDEINKRNKEEMEEQVAEYKNASPENKLIFRHAIANGDIESKFSPWKMEGLRRAKAQEETRDYGNELFIEYQKSPVHGSDDPEVMRNFLDGFDAKFKGKIKGIPNNILNDEFFPQRDALKNSLIQRHKERQMKAFEEESDRTIQANLETLSHDLEPLKGSIGNITGDEELATKAATDFLNLAEKHQKSGKGSLTKSEVKEVVELRNRIPASAGKMIDTVDKVIVKNDGEVPKGVNIGSSGYLKIESVVDTVTAASLAEKRTGKSQILSAKEKITLISEYSKRVNPTMEENKALDPDIVSTDQLSYNNEEPVTGLITLPTKKAALEEKKKLETALNLKPEECKFVLHKVKGGNQIVLQCTEAFKKSNDFTKVFDGIFAGIQKATSEGGKAGYGYPQGHPKATNITSTYQTKLKPKEEWELKLNSKKTK